MEKKQAIIGAAQTLFSQFGLKKVTTDDIARSAKVSKATIYKHYRNKSAIFDEVVKLEAQQLLNAIREATAQEPSMAGKMKAHVVSRMNTVCNLINLYRVTQDTWGDFWPHLAEMDEWLISEETALLSATMREGVSLGEFEINRIDFAARMAVVAFKSIEFPWTMQKYGVTPAEYADMMVDMMLNGIRKR